MSEYEFTGEQNQAFDKLAKTLRNFAIAFGIWAALLLVMGVVGMGGGIGTGWSPISSIVVIFAGIVGVIIAFLFLKPVGNFRRITTTEGNDITELLTALENLNKSHNLFRIAVAVAFLASFIGLIMILMR